MDRRDLTPGELATGRQAAAEQVARGVAPAAFDADPECPKCTAPDPLMAWEAERSVLVCVCSRCSFLWPMKPADASPVAAGDASPGPGATPPRGGR